MLRSMSVHGSNRACYYVAKSITVGLTAGITVGYKLPFAVDRSVVSM